MRVETSPTVRRRPKILSPTRNAGGVRQRGQPASERASDTNNHPTTSIPRFRTPAAHLPHPSGRSGQWAPRPSRLSFLPSRLPPSFFRSPPPVLARGCTPPAVSHRMGFARTLHSTTDFCRAAFPRSLGGVGSDGMGCAKPIHTHPSTARERVSESLADPVLRVRPAPVGCRK
jgi:hypothetical protein